MTTRIKNIDPYCNFQYSQEASDALEQLGQLFASATKLEQVSASCEAIAELTELTFSVESFGEKVKDVLKRVWDFLVKIAKNIWEGMQKHQSKNGDNKAYTDGTAKKKAKETPTPEAKPDVKAELLKIAKAIDENLKKGIDAPVDVSVNLPFSDKKVDALMRKLQGLLLSNQRRFSSKLNDILPGVEFRDLTGAIYAAHYSVSDVIMQILNEIKQLHRDQDIGKIRTLHQSLDSKTELKDLTKMIKGSIKLENDDGSALEQYKTAILALHLRFKDETSIGYPSADVVTDLFDTSKAEIYRSIDQVSTTLALIAKDKLGNDVKFLATILEEAKNTDTSRVAFEDVDYVKEVLRDVMFMLQATDGFVKMVVQSADTEKSFINRFLEVQTFLSGDKE